MHKKDMGKWGEGKVITQALEHGCSAFIDFGDNSKTDIIIEDDQHNLFKIQVKTVKRVKGVTTLLLYKNGPGYRFKYLEGMVDYFALVDFDSGNIAWIEATNKLFESSSVGFRHEPARNGQTRGVSWFADYTRFPFKYPTTGV